MMKTDTIIFDFGGVLIEWNPRHFYRSYFNDEEKMEWFLKNICTGEWNAEQDRGRSFEEGTRILREAYPEWTEAINAYYEHWEKMVPGEVAGTVEILQALQQQYKVYGLTNWSAETFPVAFRRFDFLHSLDGIVVSGVEKLIKPGKEIFQLLLNRYGLQARQCVFIDDSLANINTAKELGFEAIHFTSAGELKKQLALLEMQ